MKKIISMIMVAAILFTMPMYAGAAPSKDSVKKLPKKTDAQIIQETLDSMTLDEKIAQMMLVFVPPEKATSIQKQYQFGGYLFFAKNFEKHTKQSKLDQINGYQKASKIKMLMAVDEEGGTVNRVSKFKAFRSTPFKSPRAVYQAGGWDGVKADTKEKAKLLKSIGLNTNLAPVADVAYSSKDYIYKRSFSTNAESTSKFITTVVTEMQKQNVISTLKHFPGYGNNGNTHTSMIRDKRSLKTFKNRDLLPFQAGIDSGCDMIMVSHDIVYAFDKNNPASLSKDVHNYIRKEMRFKGVLISDALNMQAAADFVKGNQGDVAVKAIIAGNDMICIEDYKLALPAIKKAVKNGKISEAQINKSVARILKMKLKHGIISR